MTGLHWASRRGHFEAVELLVKYKSDLNALDICSRTPLYFSLVN
jgi:ankyrin repeat protein